MGKFDTVDYEFLRKRSVQKWGKWDEDTISLSVADIDFRAPDFIRQGVIQALEEDRTPYGPMSGDPELLEVISEKLNRANHIPAGPEDVHMIPGTMFAIFLACYYALSPGNEAVICPAPVYPPFIANIKNAQAQPVFNPVRYSRDRCALDLEDLEKQITPDTKLLMVCNPHNPCGLVLTRAELEGIAEIALKNDLLIFSDELYEDMVIEGEHTSLASLGPEVFERTLTVFGFSKAFGIPGYRIAYLVNHGEHLRQLKKLMHDIIVHTDALAQAAAKAALLHGEEWLASFRLHLREMRDYALERLAGLPGVWCSKPEGSPFVFPNLSSYGKTSREMSKFLLDRAKIVVPSGSDFGPPGEGHVRINVATARPVLEEAFDRMEAALREI